MTVHQNGGALADHDMIAHGREPVQYDRPALLCGIARVASADERSRRFTRQ
jgi:hypothetical protein